MSLQHIRCTPECSSKSDPLFVNACGSCLYHKKCAPVWCRCGTKIDLQHELKKNHCIFFNCKNKISEKNGFLCKEHSQAIESFIVNKLSILGKISISSLQEMIEFFSNQKMLGDFSHLCYTSILSLPQNNWKIFLSEDENEWVYFSSVVKKEVEKTDLGTKEVIKKLNIPEVGYSFICDDAKLQRHGWTFDSKRNPIPVSKQEIKEKKGLLTKIINHKNTAVDVKSLVLLYPEAAKDLLMFCKEGKLSMIDNSRMVCLNTKQQYDETLYFQWMQHVASD